MSIQPIWACQREYWHHCCPQWQWGEETEEEEMEEQENNQVVLGKRLLGSVLALRRRWGVQISRRASAFCCGSLWSGGPSEQQVLVKVLGGWKQTDKVLCVFRFWGAALGSFFCFKVTLATARSHYFLVSCWWSVHQISAFIRFHNRSVVR